MINLSVNRLTGVPESLEIDGTKYELRAVVNKPPKGKPVTILQGKQLFEGDTYWYYDGYWSLHENHVSVNDFGICDNWELLNWTERCFITEQFAEEFKRDFMPVYPLGVVDKWMRMLDDSLDPISIKPAINKVLDEYEDYNHLRAAMRDAKDQEFKEKYKLTS